MRTSALHCIAVLLNSMHTSVHSDIRYSGPVSLVCCYWHVCGFNKLTNVTRQKLPGNALLFLGIENRCYKAEGYKARS